MTPPLPAGYCRVAHPGASVVARNDCAGAIRRALAQGTLYAWAGSQPQRDVLQGRRPAYAVPLAGAAMDVVVRRNHHGGWLARWRGDRFVRPRASRELEISLRLAALGVRTPEVVAYAEYRVNAIEWRSDVVTRRLPAGRDLGNLLLDDSAISGRGACFVAVHSLLDALAAAGAHHPDLNVKNIYLMDEDPPRAAVLDVDRVKFTTREMASRANAARLVRSLDKWRRTRGAVISPVEAVAMTDPAVEVE